MFRNSWWILLGIGCSDPDSKSVPDSDTGVAIDTQGGDTSDTDPERECGDFEDMTPVETECLHVEEEGDLGVAVKWELSDPLHFPEFNEVLMTPLVIDIDGDGEREVLVVGDHDDNDDGTRGVLHIVDGDGEVEDSKGYLKISTPWTNYQYHPYRFTNLAAGDVNQDGEVDIVMVVEELDPPHDDPGPPPDCDPILPPPPLDKKDIRCFVAALNHKGEAHWISSRPFECGAHAPALVDLEGDGSVEVLVGPVLLEGADGSARFWLPTDSGHGRYDAYAEIGYHSVASDLDGDGISEIIAGSSVYKSDGTLLCHVEVDGEMGSDVDGFAAPFVLQEGEDAVYALVGNGMLRIVDASCSVRVSVRIEGAGNGGPPTVADFTGDGVPDVAVANSNTVAVYTSAGELVWSEGITDVSSHALGLMAFDFEGDGRMELVYGDEVALYIRDGRTGRLRLVDESHTSRTAHEYPVIADVDDDGRPDLVVPNGGSHAGSPSTGFYVLEGTEPAWLGGPSDWNQHAYDGMSPQHSAVPSDRFRSADQNPYGAGEASNLIGYAEWCPTSSGSKQAELYLGVANAGSATVRAGLSAALYAVSSDSTEHLLVELSTPQPLQAGQLHAFEPMPMDLASADADYLIWRVDDASGVETVRECDESDNEVRLSLD